MRGIDWDKVRRNRKVWKPDYREDFRREEKSTALTTSLSNSSNLVKSPAKQVFTQPLSAREIKLRLKNRGVRGDRLKRLVNAVLTGEEQLGWVEFDSECEEMRGAGFFPLPHEERDGVVLLRFQRHSTIGVLVEERVYTLTKVVP